MPRSSRQVAEDPEYVLFSAVLFRRVADTFKANARTRGFQASPKPFALRSKTPPRFWHRWQAPPLIFQS